MVRAAQYVRMSTEHQQYSIANQIATISEYATSHGFDIVRTYSDEARSGIDLKRRPGLRQLLDHVITRIADFEAVLVYDVSRWGRFQDTDEGAHYEFLCKQVGVQVHYCAEQFVNDGTMLASLIKAVKRSMAGEYLRELSVKVYAGQRRLTTFGYRMGATPRYALRRMLLSPDGTPVRQLEPGEWKGLKNQRVVLVPGPKAETAVVRKVFSMYLDDSMSVRTIDLLP
jgi:DNA invertase Pin-like site-specific DNA recombinase